MPDFFKNVGRKDKRTKRNKTTKKALKLRNEVANTE